MLVLGQMGLQFKGERCLRLIPLGQKTSSIQSTQA